MLSHPPRFSNSAALRGAAGSWRDARQRGVLNGRRCTAIRTYLSRLLMELTDEVSGWIVARKLLGNLPRTGDLRRRKPPQAARMGVMRCDRSLLFERIAEFLDPWLSF